MAPCEKKWDAQAERDLCIAIILASQEEGRPRYSWKKVLSILKSVGQEFTEGAVTQRFSKVIMKDFKARVKPGPPSDNDAGDDNKDSATASDKNSADNADADADADAADDEPLAVKPEKPKKAIAPRKKAAGTPAKEGSASAVKRRRGRKPAGEGGAEADGGSAKKTKVEEPEEPETPTKVKKGDVVAEEEPEAENGDTMNADSEAPDMEAAEAT